MNVLPYNFIKMSLLFSSRTLLNTFGQMSYMNRVLYIIWHNYNRINASNKNSLFPTAMISNVHKNYKTVRARL